MKKTFRIAPSILSADFTRLGEEVHNVLAAGADWIHFDVMDNHYVPNLTFGPMVCKAIRAITDAPIDVHLMVRPVDAMVEAFAKAGANIISFHPEASDHVDRTLALIKDLGCKAALALNPATSLSCLDYVIERLDMVLLMTVNPGFGGQEFIEPMIDKIRQLRIRLDQADHPVLLQVDGGVGLANLDHIARAGADTFVAGSAVFGSDDYVKTIGQMRQILAGLDAG